MPPSSPVLQLYVRFVGAWDQTRFTTVLTNYETMLDGFGTKIQLDDGRNTVFARDWYAACFRGRVATALVPTAAG